MEEQIKKIYERVEALEKNHNRTMEDMSDIWDDLFEVKCAAANKTVQTGNWARLRCFVD